MKIDATVETGRPCSPFYAAVLPFAAVADEATWSMDRLLAAVRSGEAEEAAGALLVSAIWHGALLDPRRWDAWLARVLGRHDIVPGWLDLPATQGERTPARWFADPTTRLLLDRWRERRADDEPALSGSTRCLAAFLGEEATAAFALRAEWRWRLRLPGVLMEKALGRTEDSSLPAAAWRRVFLGTPVQVSKPPPEEAHQPIAAVRVPPPPVSAIERLLSQKALRQHADDNRHRSLRQQRNDLLRTAVALPVPVLPRAALLHEFGVALLSAPLRASARRSYAPSTVGRYVSLLRRKVFDSAWLADPEAPEPGHLWHRCDVAIQRSSGDARGHLIDAIEAFDRFLATACPYLAHAEPARLGRLRNPERGGVVNLVSGADYARALSSLNGSAFDVRQARLCLVLGYRAGLRDRELRAIAVNDIVCADDDPRCQLLIRRKRHAETKTGTSRRILPLDLLLEPAELADLRAWVGERRGVAPSGATVRLFSSRDRPTQPMPKGFLGKHLVPVLRAATSDAGIAYGSLRHSFVSCLLATLLLPDDGTSLLIPAGWNEADVSHRRKRRVTAGLTGSNRLGQGALHGVGLLAGHLSTGTTLRDYAHVLDWVLGAHVGRPVHQPGLTITQAAVLAGLSEAAVRKRIQRLSPAAPAVDAGSGYQLPVVARGRRGPGRATTGSAASAYPDQLLGRGTQQHGENLSRPRSRPPTASPVRKPAEQEVIAWRDLLACVKAAATGADIDRPAIAVRFCVAPDGLDRWMRARASMMEPGGPGAPVRSGHPVQRQTRPTGDRRRREQGAARREAAFPRRPTDREADLIDPLWERAMRARTHMVAEGVRLFATRYHAHDNAVIVLDWAEARRFQQMLDALGAGASVTLRHRPGRGRRPQPIAAAATSRPPRGIGKDDRVAFVLARSGDAGRRARTSGLRQTLTLLGLLHLGPTPRREQLPDNGCILHRRDVMDRLAWSSPGDDLHRPNPLEWNADWSCQEIIDHGAGDW